MKRVLTSLVIGLTVAAGVCRRRYGPGCESAGLRAQTVVSGNTVRLADVLVMTDADPQLAQQIGDAPVASKPGATPIDSISHEQVVKRLDEVGVNLSRVLVSGALQCRITRPNASAATTATDDEAALFARRRPTVTASRPWPVCCRPREQGVGGTRWHARDRV